MAVEITISGPQRSGKSRLIASIRKLLQSQGHRVTMALDSELREAEVRCHYKI